VYGTLGDVGVLLALSSLVGLGWLAEIGLGHWATRRAANGDRTGIESGYKWAFHSTRRLRESVWAAIEHARGNRPENALRI